MKSKVIVLCVVLPVLLFALAGCNLFGWTSSDNTESLIDEGNRLMREGDYDAAVEKFAQAMEEDPDLSDARYYHAKASIRAAGFNVLTLAATMSESEFEENADLPFMGGTWAENNRDKANRLYGATITIYDDLLPIFHNETHGSLDSVDIDLDYAITCGLRGVLLFQDTNMDGVIDENDFDLDIFFDDSSDDFEIENWEDFENTIGEENVDEYLDLIFELVEESAEVLADIINSMSEDGGVSPEDIDAFMDEIEQLLEQYREDS